MEMQPSLARICGKTAHQLGLTLFGQQPLGNLHSPALDKNAYMKHLGAWVALIAPQHLLTSLCGKGADALELLKEQLVPILPPARKENLWHRRDILLALKQYADHGLKKCWADQSLLSV
jgi:hypothetical protein